MDKLKQLDEILDLELIPVRDQDIIKYQLRIFQETYLELKDSAYARGAEARLSRLEDEQRKSIRQLHRLSKEEVEIKNALTEIVYLIDDIVNYNPDSAKRIIVETKNDRLGSLGVGLTEFSYIPFAYFECDDIEEAQKELQACDINGIREKNYFLNPMKEMEQSMWNLDMLNVKKAWEKSRGEGIKIGVADTGVDYKHTELRERFGESKGYDFVNDNDDPRDDNGHGTHVAGTIAGKQIGIATESRLYGLKFLNAMGRGKEVDFIKAAEWAIENKLQLLNGSFGSGMPSVPERAVCDELYRRGIIFASSSGNNGTKEYGYPASYKSVISVGAVDQEKRRARFSQYNNQLNISAPGVRIYSSYPGSYKVLSGTSMACPHVIGSLALLMSENHDHEYVRELLMKGCEELGEANEYGKGLVRPDKSLELKKLVERWAA